MKKNVCLIGFSMSIVIIINSCTLTSLTSTNMKPKISIQAGINNGGITENSDMSLIENIIIPVKSTVDAFTGATRIGFNAGVHVNQPLLINQVETGIDYMYNNQTFTYVDAGNNFLGVRKLNVSQVMLPLTYNFWLFKRSLHDNEIQFKVGYLWQLNTITATGTGILPEYTINSWSKGFTFGISAYLIKFNDGNKIGVYIDAYRGSQIYSDYYNQSSFPMTGSSFLKFGLRYQFK